MGGAGRPGIPVRNAIRRRVREVEIASGAGGLFHDGDGLFVQGQGVEELQLFGEAAHGPGEPARPGAERRVALLRIGAAVIAIVDVEDALVRGASAYVVGIAAFAVPDGILRGGAGVLGYAVDQRNLPVVLAHQHVSQQVADGGRAQGTYGVHDERVRAVERIDVPAAS